MMAASKSYAWNCGGLRRSTNVESTLRKVMFFENSFKSDFDFFFFLETHHSDENDIPNELLRYDATHHIIHSPRTGQDKYAGIIGLVSKKYDITDEEHMLQGRLVGLRLQECSTGKSFRLSAVYFPTNQKLDLEQIDSICNKLRFFHSDQDTTNVILGDFNFIDNPRDKKNGLNSKDRLLNTVWVPFLEEMDLVDPFREQNPNRTVWSFVGNGNSRIDRVYIDSVSMGRVTNLKYIRTPFHGHRILSFHLKNTVEWGKSYFKLNTSLFEDEQYATIVDEAIDEVGRLTNRNIKEKWEIFMMSMKTKSIRYSSRRNWTKKRLKIALIRQIEAIEENNLQHSCTPHYEHLKGRLKEIQDKEIDGYITRVRFLAPYEKSECDVAFFSKLEDRKKASDGINQLAEKQDGEIFTDRENILRIATNFYKNRYTSEKVNEKIQDKLLGKIKTKLSKEVKDELDAPITVEEVEKAIDNLPRGKSPGIDGFPVEFYKVFWTKIKTLFMAYLRAVKRDGLPNNRNVSIIKLSYKKKGEICLLSNYRPISLINADVKIITKVLAERLKLALPSIIHPTQTAVYGRRIDQNIHLVRDLIDIANRDNDTAAFIFLDQEKAFDRVNHKFLFRVMETFGIGENFVGWVRRIYSNATSVLGINGFFSEKIPLQRGVRQGCPLSALLYVLVLEVLAVQLRSNPNIVGFTIGGEKIVSVHYMDDTTIIIKQNRCFKEVIKELSQYSEASEAKVNYSKTKGLWAGSWKGRRLSPMDNIKWTSGNVQNLGIYFGNNDPGQKTFDDIVPKFQRRLGYWKQFTLTKIGKARVVEMFLASKLVYAMKFYPIPPHFQKQLQNSIFKYVNFPNKVITIGQKEMWKIKVNGGCKLVNMQVKSETSKAKWLMEMATNPNFRINLLTFTDMLGVQGGNNFGRDLIFMDKSFISRTLKTPNRFYKEAFQALSQFDRMKGIPLREDWDNENIFHNPLVLGKSGKTLKETKHFQDNKIFKLGQLLDEKAKEARGIPHDRNQVSLLKNSTLYLGPSGIGAVKDDWLFFANGTDIKMTCLTQKDLYEDAILRKSRDHKYQTKWVDKLNTVIIWEEVWASVHNNLHSNATKCAIWEQLHLNFYTQYSYNKWHDSSDLCPLCQKSPVDIFHIILDCDFANSVWTELQPFLRRLLATNVNDQEKALGIVSVKPSPGILLRNWVTFKVREQIMVFERKAHHSGRPSLESFKVQFNREMADDVRRVIYRLMNEGSISKINELITHRGALCRSVSDDSFMVNDVF